MSAEGLLFAPRHVKAAPNAKASAEIRPALSLDLACELMEENRNRFSTPCGQLLEIEIPHWPFCGPLVSLFERFLELAR